MKDLYTKLGVNENSTKDEIRDAYRDLAKQNHPDKPSGDTEKFQEIQLAYSILSNDEKRDRYDKTGQTSSKPNFDSVLSSYINGILEEIINSGKDVDIIDFLKRVTEKQLEQMNKSVSDIKKKEDKINKLINSYKINKGNDAITPIFNDKIKQLQGQLILVKEEIKTMKDIYDVISGYKYEYTPQFTTPNDPFSGKPFWFNNMGT